ncbi:hypothetical protein JOE59_002770 [Agromyces cerinus]|uniref:hypothetical protein n=1 Tax=Agromyces cerinus TaxID=33878 RepID=UPI00195E07BB|nr:hypothetical protein [Agromyces cerinus]MBM7832065.1 hypothetical protein [Agromyces cerinus]
MTEKAIGDLDLPPVVSGLITKLATVSTSVDPSRSRHTGSRGAWIPIDSFAPFAEGQSVTERSDGFLYLATGVSTELADRAADLRALITAYAQRVATRRPELAELARWQRVSPSALRHRYNDLHVQAIRELMAEDPLIDIVIEPFTTVLDEHFEGLSPALDEQLELRRRMRRACADEFVALYGESAHTQMGFAAVPTNPRSTRMLVDFGTFMTVALKRRDPDLLPIYAEWVTRFEKRKVKEHSSTSTRIRKPAT